jgi:outer membrane protein OmpA-like peptidoglycan-associated protein
MIFLAFGQSGASQDIVKENLGAYINTSYADTKPVISPDGKTLYFTRQFYPGNVKGVKDAQDIYYSTYIDGTWTRAVNIGAPLNDKYPNGVSGITPDGNTMLVLNAYDDNTIKNGVSVSKRQGSGWSTPKMLTINNYYNINPYVDYFLSNNEQALLLTIQTDDAVGDQDLYISFRINEYQWTEPINLGTTINSEKAEFAPFLAADNKTLFFSSEGHGSYGSSDIFYSKRLDDSWQKWTDPINLGHTINSEAFEGYYTIPASGDFAYYVSTKGGIEGSKDIFKTSIPYEFLPDPVLLVSGHVLDKKSRKPVECEIQYAALQADVENGIANSDSYNGAYKIVLPRGNAYRYVPVSEGYIGIPQYLNVGEIEEYHEMENNLFLVPLESGQVVPFHDIFFEGTTAETSYDSKDELLRILEIMQDNPGIQIEITGYTSDLKHGQDNLALSIERAWSVKHFMLNNGVHTERMVHRGLGSTVPFNDHDILLKEGIDPMNRIELRILSLDWSAPPAEDRDNDGIDDEHDACPDQSGPFSLQGCPDSDGDTVPDHKDQCPSTTGSPKNNGCPILSKTVLKVFDEALEGIVFESAKEVIKPSSYKVLDKIVDIMNKNSDFKLKISGHTDNQGNDRENLNLSDKRALATKQYLMDKGISADRLESIGYGETKPIADNKTAQGRAVNRRVEFKVVFE